MTIKFIKTQEQKDRIFKAKVRKELDKERNKLKNIQDKLKKQFKK